MIDVNWVNGVDVVSHMTIFVINGLQHFSSLTIYIALMIGCSYDWSYSLFSNRKSIFSIYIWRLSVPDGDKGIWNWVLCDHVSLIISIQLELRHEQILRIVSSKITLNSPHIVAIMNKNGIDNVLIFQLQCVTSFNNWENIKLSSMLLLIFNLQWSTFGTTSIISI